MCIWKFVVNIKCNINLYLFQKKINWYTNAYIDNRNAFCVIKSCIISRKALSFVDIFECMFLGFLEHILKLFRVQLFEAYIFKRGPMAHYAPRISIATSFVSGIFCIACIFHLWPLLCMLIIKIPFKHFL